MQIMLIIESFKEWRRNSSHKLLRGVLHKKERHVPIFPTNIDKRRTNVIVIQYLLIGVFKIMSFVNSKKVTSAEPIFTPRFFQKRQCLVFKIPNQLRLTSIFFVN